MSLTGFNVRRMMETEVKEEPVEPKEVVETKPTMTLTKEDKKEEKE